MFEENVVDDVGYKDGPMRAVTGIKVMVMMMVLVVMVMVMVMVNEEEEVM
jgi:hypothetical protein